MLGEVIGADGFGNAVTSITAADLAWLGPGPVGIRVGDVRVSLVAAYSEAGEGAPGAILGSQGRLEIFVREGSAQVVLGLAPGTPVRVLRLPSATTDCSLSPLGRGRRGPHGYRPICECEREREYGET